MSKVFKVFIGRLQPAHRAHITIMRGALESKYNETKYSSNPNNLILVVGSAWAPSDPKNPFSLEEREEMIRSAFSAEENKRIHIVGVADSLYNNNDWLEDVQNSVAQVVEEQGEGEDEIQLVGHNKDEETSEYLNQFPQWKVIGIRNIDDLHATTIRDYFFNTKWQEEGVDTFAEMCQSDLDPNIFAWLLKFRETAKFELLQEEFSFLEKHKEMWANSPYTPTFNTADAVLVQSGHILLIKRRSAPGKGLWALPGGYVDPDDITRLDSCIRELREETKLKVPDQVLRGSVQDDEEFGHPKRSLRGRIFTRAFYIKLKPGPLPKVKGNDDAEKAKWFPLSEVRTMDDQMFEDHLSIIKYFV